MTTQTTVCTQEAEIRGLMAIANYAGDWKCVKELTTQLNDHHKTCAVCNGTIYSQLWKGAKVVVR